MEQQSPGYSQPMPQQPEVSFPQPKEPGGSSKNVRLIVAIIVVVLIVVGGGWFILGNNSGSNTNTPSGDGLSTFPTPQATETPETSPTPEPEPMDKSEVRIEVLNGTGVAGEASFLQSELEDLGYEEITAANADSQNATETVATYSRDLPSVIADEITAMLEEIYTSVRTRRATISGDYDVSITTGPRKSSSATSSPSPSPQATATATPDADE